MLQESYIPRRTGTLALRLPFAVLLCKGSIVKIASHVTGLVIQNIIPLRQIENHVTLVKIFIFANNLRIHKAMQLGWQKLQGQDITIKPAPTFNCHITEWNLNKKVLRTCAEFINIIECSTMDVNAQMKIKHFFFYYS